MNQKRIIAVCGKGGDGKTAFTSMLAHALVESGRAGKLLLIDADPAMGLPNTLGIKVEKTIAEVRETIIKTARDGEDKARNEVAGMIDYMILESLAESADLALLAMGRSDSMGCFCPVNNILRDGIDVLARQFDTILIDGEAGLEQLNRQVMRRVNTLLVLSDSSWRGLQTVEYIKNMVDHDKVLECDRLGVIFNRVAAESQPILTEAAARIGVELLGFVPPDANITRYDLTGRALGELPMDTEALAAVRDLARMLLQ